MHHITVLLSDINVSVEEIVYSKVKNVRKQILYEQGASKLNRVKIGLGDQKGINLNVDIIMIIIVFTYTY